MKIKKIGLVILVTTIVLSVFSTFVYQSKVIASDTVVQGPEQNKYYTIIDDDGNVITKEYEEDKVPNTLKSNDYKIIKTVGNEETEIESHNTYEEAEAALKQFKRGRATGTYDVQAYANTSKISYGVARIIGYVEYTEVDNGKKGRPGYTHGTSANDAAFISESSDGSTVRVKQAGIVMDIPANKVEVTAYSNNSKVSYYIGKNGKFYHYYYNGSYGSTSSLSSTQVGFTPSGLKDNIKYYSYDGHYFYTDYKKMINDYHKGLDYYGNAVNANNPYYNYYQYLSFRSKTRFAAGDMNKLITDTKGANTKSKLKGQGQSLLNNQNKYGVNASLMLGVAINESAWGLSKYSQDRNNLFGIGAVDSNPDKAYRFDSVEECFNYFAYNMLSGSSTEKRGYFDAMSWKYRGPHLGDKRSGVNVKYASDPYWGEKAASFSYRINANTGNKDYGKYQIAIAKTGKLNFYRYANTSDVVYNSTVNDSTNENLYAFPVTILSTSGNYYKILSDTVLNSSRTGQNPVGLFDVNRDYVYVKTSDVDLNGTTSISYKRGDVNGNGKIDAADYLMIMDTILGKYSMNSTQKLAGDVNDNGKIDAADYLMIMDCILGKINL